MITFTELLGVARCRVAAVVAGFMALAFIAGAPQEAAAQTGCGGALGISTSPDTQPPNELLALNLPTTVGITLTPAAAAGTNDITTDQVRYALACFDNGDQVPCTSGNDPADGGGQPVDFVGLTGGTCAGLSATDNGDTVDFDFTSTALGEGGCTIEFDVSVLDKGTDASPLILTGAAGFDGTCLGGTLEGGADASIPIFLEELDCVPEITKCVVVDVNGDGVFDEACFTDTENGNPNLGPALGLIDPPKDFKYFVTVGNSGADTLTECTLEDGAGIVFAGSINSGQVIPLMSEVDICDDPVEDNTATLTCLSCNEEQIEIEPVMASASVECLNCQPEVQKTISCDGGATFDESCTGWTDQAEVVFAYEFGVAPDSDVDLRECVLFDDGVDGGPPGPIVDGIVNVNFDLAGGGFPTGDTFETDADSCGGDAFTPGVNTATLSCLCATSASGDPLRPGAELPPFFGSLSEPNGIPGLPLVCAQMAMNSAELLCNDVDLSVNKVCLEQGDDSEGDVEDNENKIVVTVENTSMADDSVGEANLLNCVAVDTLDPLGTPTVIALTAISSPLLPGAPEMLMGVAVDLEEDTKNEVVVTCEIEGSTCPLPGVGDCSEGGLKTVTRMAMDDCEVPVEGCWTRTPGYWATHMREAAFIVGEDIPNCGIWIDSTEAVDGSTVEDMCSIGKDRKDFNEDLSTSPQQVQLVRQCMAAQLNLRTTGFFEGSCDGTPGLPAGISDMIAGCCGILEDTNSNGGGTCNDPGATQEQQTACIGLLDMFNNFDDEEFEADNVLCGDEPAPFGPPCSAMPEYCQDAKNNKAMNTGRTWSGEQYGPVSNGITSSSSSKGKKK